MNFFEKFTTWLLRVLLAPIALFLGWYAIRGFFSMGVEESLSPIAAGSNGMELALAGLLFYAIIYPAPPWRNKPLVDFLSAVVCILIVVTWWVGTLVGSGYLINFLFGPNIRFYGVVVFIIWIAINSVILFLLSKLDAFLYVEREIPCSFCHGTTNYLGSPNSNGLCLVCYGSGKKRIKILKITNRKNNTIISKGAERTVGAEEKLLELLDGHLRSGRPITTGSLTSSDKGRLDDILLTLTEREEKTIRLRCGIGDGYPRTAEEVGYVFNVNPEQVRQIEADALRKLHHSAQLRKLKDETHVGL